MPFIDTSLMTADRSKQSAPQIVTNQQGSLNQPTASQKIDNFVSGVSRDISAVGVSINSEVNNVRSQIAQGANQVNRLRQDAVNFVNNRINQVNNTIRTVNNTFAEGKLLASSISADLKNIFRNTNNPQASDRATLISDPVATNLFKPIPPNAASFRVTSLGTNTDLSNNRTPSIFGSKDLQMIGTNSTTLIDRFNLDSITNLPRNISNDFSTNKINGLLSSSKQGGNRTSFSQSKLGKTLSSIGSTINTVRRTVNTAVNTVNQVKQQIVQTYNVFNQIKTQVENDVGNFIGHVSNLSNSLGNANFSSYYTQNPRYSLLDQDGNYVNTNRSGVDFQTANSIRNIVKTAGVTDYDGYYLSAHEQASSFNLGLIASSANGMLNEVNRLINLPFALTDLGQRTISNAFRIVSNTDLPMASLLSQKIQNPNQLKVSELTKSILTNDKLVATDQNLISDTLSNLGTDFQKSTSLPKISTPKYPVYDAVFFSGIKPPVLDQLLGDKSVTNYFDGKQTSLNNKGQLII